MLELIGTALRKLTQGLPTQWHGLPGADASHAECCTDGPGPCEDWDANCWPKGVPEHPGIWVLQYEGSALQGSRTAGDLDYHVQGDGVDPYMVLLLTKAKEPCSKLRGRRKFHD